MHCSKAARARAHTHYLCLSSSMNQALKLGFGIFINLKSFAVNQRNIKAGPLIFPRPKTMESKTLLSSSTSKAGTRVVKENVLRGRMVESEILEDDQDSVERMTVQQLRLKLRSVGVPAKGSKRDLVSALKCFLGSKVDGESSLAVEDQLSSKVPAMCPQNNPKRKTISSSSGDHDQTINVVSEVNGIKWTKRKVKQGLVDAKVVGLHATKQDLSTKQELSIETSEITVSKHKKSTQAKRKKPSEMACGDLGASVRVDFFENQNEPWTVLAHKKPEKGWIPYNPKTMRSPPLTGDTKHVKLMSWNVNGLRALLKLEGFSALQLAQREDFDILCFQETKLQEKDVDAVKQTLLEGYENSFWTCSVSKLGYSGTAIISRIKPLSVRYGLGISDHDSEGRLVTVELSDFYLLSGYVPNSGDGLKRLSYRVTQWDPSLGKYMKELEKSKPVILTGDLNCAHEEIDIYNPAGNRRSAGFTDEERQSFEANFLNKGFVDTFRKQHPGVVGYTYWGYRHGGRKTNKGWRLDYFLVSESISDQVHDSYILPDVTGSDHSPIGLVLKI